MVIRMDERHPIASEQPGLRGTGQASERCVRVHDPEIRPDGEQSGGHVIDEVVEAPRDGRGKLSEARALHGQGIGEPLGDLERALDVLHHPDTVAARVGQGELAHPPRLISEVCRRNAHSAQLGVPVFNVGDDQAATGEVRFGCHQFL